MSNSSLVNYTKLSPNYNPRGNNKIKKITIHQMAGNLTVETCGNVFAPASRQASANYGVGTDGRIGMYVEEKNRAWTSSSPDNDYQAVTIEVANDGGANTNWHVSDTALEATINLCVDICKRNGIASLNYTGDTSGNLTRHDMFVATCCPGPYLGSKFPYIASEVNRRLKGGAATTPTPTKQLYRVRKTWADSKSQIGAYSSLDNAKKACKPGYSVFDNSGKVVYTAGGSTSSSTSNTGTWTQNTILKIGDRVKSVSCAIAAWPGTNSAIKGNLVYCPALGGGIPLDNVTEASDSKDGKVDNYLANANARITLDECTVQKLDTAKDLAYVSFGYWVKCGPLMAKR